MHGEAARYSRAYLCSADARCRLMLQFRHPVRTPPPKKHANKPRKIKKNQHPFRAVDGSVPGQNTLISRLPSGVLASPLALTSAGRYTENMY